MKNTIEYLISYGIKELEEANIDDAKLKAKILLAFVIEKTKEYLIIHKEEIINEEKIEKYNFGIKKLKQNIPIQYITHEQKFMGLSFYVDENVLISRFDTEILVDEIIRINNQKENINILDMCTGSGAIAISLAKNIKNSKVLRNRYKQRSFKNSTKK